MLIAEDDSEIHKPPKREVQPERNLILGWNDRAPGIVADLDQYVYSGPEVTAVNPDGGASPPMTSSPAYR